MTKNEFIAGLPKAELHLHIGGTFEPELMIAVASRNGKQLAYDSIEELKAAYRFNNLQEFLDLFHMGTSVLMKEQDYYDMTWAYMERVHADQVKHTEIFFDAQTHTERGISFDTVINGIKHALSDAESEFGITSCLIPSFLRHLGEEQAFVMFREAMQYRDWITAFGLASSELGHPPSKFKRVFDAVRAEGFPTLAHAGEEGPADYIWEALELLEIDRLDHGNRSIEDESLIEEIKKRDIALTLCPLSNLELKVIHDIKDHPVKVMMEKGLKVTVNSDDPAYFGGYINANFEAVAEAVDLSKDQLVELAVNSFQYSFLPEAEKDTHIQAVYAYAQSVELN